MDTKVKESKARLGKQVVLFLFVGGFCYGVSMVFLYIFADLLNLEVNLANLLASLIAIYVAYVLNGRIIFDKGKHSPGKEISMFFLFSFFGLLLNVSSMYLLVTFTPISIYVSKTLVTIGVSVFNFITRKLFVFNG